MGKWTPNYTDNVLHTKLSALITGAINRAAVEKEPTITYDNFVHELDTGDSFTTSLVDILVKELAERHTRPCQNDELKLIAPRTAERLLSLANRRQIYRGERSGNRNHTGRRTFNLAGFMDAASSEMEMDEDENDFASFLDASTNAAEGARFNTDLFDAYGPHSWSPFTRRSGATPSPPIDDDAPVWRPLNPTARSSAWAAVSNSNNGSSTSLTRHPSIRRPTRSRMVDFHDWTSRRRSAVRDAIGTQVEASESNSSLQTQSGAGAESSQTVRRFYPTLGRRPERRLDSLEDRSDDAAIYRLGLSSLNRYPSPAQDATQVGLSTSEAQTVSEGNGGAVAGGEVAERPLPRLRRGGVRPPEELWSQHRYSWPARSPGPQPLGDHPSAGADSEVQPPSSAPSSPRREADIMPSSAEPVGYPTPGSIDNEPGST